MKQTVAPSFSILISKIIDLNQQRCGQRQYGSQKQKTPSAQRLLWVHELAVCGLEKRRWGSLLESQKSERIQKEIRQIHRVDPLLIKSETHGCVSWGDAWGKSLSALCAVRDSVELYSSLVSPSITGLFLGGNFPCLHLIRPWLTHHIFS